MDLYFKRTREKDKVLSESKEFYKRFKNSLIKIYSYLYLEKVSNIFIGLIIIF